MSNIYTIRLTPEQREALDKACAVYNYDSTAALMQVALIAHLDAVGIVFPPTRAKGANQRKAAREWVRIDATHQSTVINATKYIADKVGEPSKDWQITEAGDWMPIVIASHLATAKSIFEEWLAQQS